MATLPVRVPPRFRIIAHRGASAYAPENTLAAFRLAERMGATEVELDVQFSRDKQIVICHDQMLDRYGYPGLRLSNLTLDELLKLDMGSWFSPHLYGEESMVAFETLLAQFKDRFVYHVEIKTPTQGLVKAVLDALTANGLRSRAIVISFHFDALSEVRGLGPDLKVGWLIREGEFTTDNVARAAAAGFFQMCPPATETNREMVASAHARLAEVRAHSVKGTTEMMRAIEAGCDGLTIDWPDWLVHEDTDAGRSKLQGLDKPTVRNKS